MTLQSVQMMRLAEETERDSKCPERKVGASIAFFAAGGGRLVRTACNSPNADESNDNHAEAILIKQIELMGWNLSGAVLYVTCRPCARCTDLLVGKGVKAIYYRDKQPEMRHLQALIKDGVYLNSNWIAGQQPIELSPVQKSWAARWQQVEGV